MAVADRNILRLAVYEMLWRDAVPPKVVINESTEFVGAQPEPEFVGYLAQAAGTREVTPSE